MPSAAYTVLAWAWSRLSFALALCIVLVAAPFLWPLYWLACRLGWIDDD